MAQRACVLWQVAMMLCLISSVTANSRCGLAACLPVGAQMQVISIGISGMSCMLHDMQASQCP